MKVKKVEIQGFRAYRDAQDSTYDFMLDDGDCADFISIYAPNGFGKTSFYDAVEWGMTNNISRLLKREKENAIIAKEERKRDIGPNGEKKKQFILRNRDFGETGNAYVKIETTFQEKDFSPVRTIPNVTKKGGTDFSFNEKDTLKKMIFFRDVVLSQDWIDAFLREDTAENRYRRFMDYFGDKKVDMYYNNLVNLIKENETQIKKIEGEITELSKIPFEIADNKIIEITNIQIETLLSLGENLNKIDIYFDEQGKKELEDNINNRFIEIDNYVENLILLLEEIKIQSTKIDLFFEKKGQHNIILSEINLLKESQKRIHEREILTNQINNSRKEIEEINNQKKYIEEILKIYPVYKQAKDRISKEEDNQTKCVSTLESKNADAERIKNNIENLQKEIQKLNNNILSVDALIKDIPNIYQKIKSLNAEIKEKQEKISKLKNKYQAYLQLSNEHDKLKKKIDQNLIYFDTDAFINIDGLTEEKQANIVEIEKLMRVLESSNDIIKGYEKRISEEIQIREDVKSLIQVGTEIVEQSKTESCPLCNSKHGNFENLLKRISENPLLSNKESELLQNKSLEELKLNSNQNAINTLKIELKNDILKQQQQLDIDILKNTKNINTVKQEILSLEKEVNGKNTELETYTKRTESLGEKEFILKIENQKKRNIAAIEDEEMKLVAESEKQSLLNKDIQTITQNNKISTDIISSAKENAEYKQMLNFIGLYFLEEVNSDQIADLINQESVKIKRNEDIIVDYNSKIKELNELLLPIKVTEIENDIEKKETQLQEILKYLSDFNEFINKINAPKENIENKEQLISFIGKLHISTNENISLQKNIREEYQKLEKSKESILPYLKQIKVKEKISCAKKDLRKHTTLRNDLEKERQGLAFHIQNHINSFFHKELIVDIYSKIDPHPDYKEIDFTCNFDDTSPKLTVFVKSLGEQGKYISPSLYFSAAQLNVLSLSIFLAKALNTTDDNGRTIDCIFLDDPIQSMDSINILSTIDLLRSLVVNYKKQLILSTHEENFHLLLQRKIPENLFRSKYIKLETFGKIKQDN